MSHFAVLVVGPDPAHELAPFHEFECTGQDDEFVQNVDRTEEFRAEYETAKETRYKSPDGHLHEPYGDAFYGEPTAEETKQFGPIAGTGCGNGISWSSRDWNDGRGYRTKVHFLPAGWEEVETPVKSNRPFAEWVQDWHGQKITTAPIIDTEHKYGYTLVDAYGEVVRVIDRTNPNAKWDYWKVGGRYSNRLLLKDGRRADSAIKSDVDWFGIERDAASEATHEWLLADAIIQGRPFITWEAMREKHDKDIEAARNEYHAQSVITDWNANPRRFDDFSLDGPDGYAIPRADYIQAAVDKAFVLFAFVKDRQWQERGKMGWWATVSDEKDRSEWNRIFRAFVQSLPTDALLTIVDCHI